MFTCARCKCGLGKTVREGVRIDGFGLVLAICDRCRGSASFPVEELKRAITQLLEDT